ncbi:MAG: hypothetical protein AAFQ12_00165 [Pseudomonadota bacterium]
MRYVISSVAIATAAMTAQSEPLTIQSVMQELRDRGANSVDGALIFGDPLVTGEFDGQGFSLRLGLCDHDTIGNDCRSTVFSSCIPVPTLTELDTLKMIDTYNGDLDRRGALYSDAIVGIGPAVCVKLRRNFHDEDAFDLSDIFDWQLAFGDFKEYLDEHVKHQRRKEILGLN